MGCHSRAAGLCDILKEAVRIVTRASTFMSYCAQVIGSRSYISARCANDAGAEAACEILLRIARGMHERRQRRGQRAREGDFGTLDSSPITTGTASREQLVFFCVA